MIFFQSRLTWQKLRIKKDRYFIFYVIKQVQQKEFLLKNMEFSFDCTWKAIKSSEPERSAKNLVNVAMILALLGLQCKEKMWRKTKENNESKMMEKQENKKKTVDENKHWYNKQWVLYKMTKLSILSTAMLWRHLWINGYCHRSGLGYLCSNLKWDCFTKYWYSWERYESNNSHYG